LRGADQPLRARTGSTRTYYLSRSGLPLFYRMIGLLYPEDPPAGYASYLPELKREYSFWMHGSAGLAPGGSSEHVVALPDGALLNRFWDALGEPRDEAFREDTALAAHSPREPAALYRDRRAAAESGWGLSARWLADPAQPASVQTTALLPIDLNSVLFGLRTPPSPMAASGGTIRPAAQRSSWRAPGIANRRLIGICGARLRVPIWITTGSKAEPAV